MAGSSCHGRRAGSQRPSLRSSIPPWPRAFPLLRLPPMDSAQWPPHDHGLQQEVARYLFDVLRSSPDVFVRCRLAVLWSPVDSTRRRPPCVRCFAQPIRDAVENRGEKPPLFSMFIFRCV
jgi:hypothetical protein